MSVIQRIVFAIFVILALFLSAVIISRAMNQNRVERLATRAQEEHRALLSAVAGDNVGGKTPEETLLMFAEAIDKGDAASASALCVPALRDHVENVIAEMNAKERRETAVTLRAVHVENGEADTVTATDPVYVELIKYPSGAWKVASF